MELVGGRTWPRAARYVIACAAVVGFSCAIAGPFGQPATDYQSFVDGAPLPGDEPSETASTPSAGTASPDGTPSASAPSGSPQSPASLASMTGNLIRNGDAEVGTCSGGATGTVTIPEWSTLVGNPQVVCYGTSGFPQQSEGPFAPETPGIAFFMGGQNSTAVLQQTIAVTFAATAIDAHASTYVLSGWLGGWEGQDDAAGLVATFIGGSGEVLDSANLAPVTAVQRGGITALLRESTTGRVPAGTRTIILTLTCTRAEGNANDGYADDLVFRLT